MPITVDIFFFRRQRTVPCLQKGPSMFQLKKNKLHISVRSLVEFLLRQGDMTTGSAVTMNPDAMLEGARLHRKIQKAQKPSYMSEVPLRMEWGLPEDPEGRWDADSYKLVIEGRADGIEDRKEDGVLIDEIKCVYQNLEKMEEPEFLHLAQARCYAYIYGLQADLSRIRVRITYCHMETEEIRYFSEDCSMEELTGWFGRLLDSCRMWAALYIGSRISRNRSIRALEFPFPFRPGQKKLTALTWQAVDKGEAVFLQAPTGVGKTMSTLYPALKEIGEEKAEHIYYLTAKTITRTAAQEAIRILEEQNLSLRSVTITAKERICILDEVDCNPEACPRALGHYDRINQALYELLQEKNRIDREAVLEFAERFQVCPYELSFEAAAWADLVICDYNYVFDPHVNRKSMFLDSGAKKQVLLVDEAHNLLDRAREMYSASLCHGDFLDQKKIFRVRSKVVHKALNRCDRILTGFSKKAGEETDPSGSTSLPEGVFLLNEVDGLYYPLLHLLGKLEEYLKDHENFEERDEVVNFYFHLHHFYYILDTMDGGYLIYGQGKGRSLEIFLMCVDPSGQLEEYIEGVRACIFFSATMLPIRYFRELLGGDRNNAYFIPSPFDHKHRLLAVTSDVTSRYSRRGPEMYGKIVRYLEIQVEKQRGNYMIFFPSYEMLSEVVTLASESTLGLVADLLVQTPSMEEKEREEFLDRFKENEKQALVGFCVLGSIFSEGIDLQGKRLIGVMIVGTGLPMLCREREMIRSYYDARGKKGYDFAYRFPGMNKVLQAAGRLIRSTGDVGTILLMDDRFLERSNQELLPADWDSYYPVHENNYGLLLEKFWKEQEERDMIRAEQEIRRD